MKALPLTLFMQLDLRGKITAALLAATLAMGAVVTLTAYFVARHQLTTHAQALLAARAELERREIELRLTGMLEQAQSLAGNTVTANALADSRGRETYLDPLLRNQRLSLLAADLTMVDYRGRPAASSIANAPHFGRHPAFVAMLEKNAAQAVVVAAGSPDASLVVALPIVYRLTGNIEGGLLLRIPLAPLLMPSTPTEAHRLIAAGGAIQAGRAHPTEAFTVTTPLALPAPLDDLQLGLVLAHDRATALGFLQVLLATFLAIGVLVIVGVALFARAGARFITGPLEELATAAETIAASGRPATRLQAGRADEFGRLAAAFNTMVDRLAESYGDLERRVAERTREYEESQHETEKASKLLREAVGSIAQGFTIYDENDRLVLCNEAYRDFYRTSRDLIVPGNTFAQIVRQGAERGQYEEAIGNIDAWVAQRVAQHQSANGEVIEQQLGDGRWLLIVEYRTPSGYIVGNRIDITALKQATEALRERELYLRATLDNLPFLFWLKGTDSRFLAVNKMFAAACGRGAPEEIVGLTDLDIWPRELAERYRADDLEVITSRREKTVEEPIAGGSASGWIETYKKPVIDADGTVLGTVGFARDISERKQMEQALAESEQRWALAVKGTNDGVWDWNIASGAIYFSDRWLAMLGYAAGELAGRIEEWRAMLHPDDAPRVLTALERHFAGLTDFYEVEFRLRCKDGGYKWILGRGKALCDAAGTPVRMAGSHTDITARREAEARVRDRTEQLDAIFDLSPDGFVSFDAEHRVKYASPAFLRLTGFAEQDIVGRGEADFSAVLAAACIESARFPGIAALRAPRKVGAGGTAGESGGRRQLIELAGAGKRVLEIGLRLSRAETVSQILYCRDVTHEIEVDRMKSEFLSTAAHELRTPMASIYGFTELLLNQDFAAADRREFLATIYRQAELMVSIINELLDLARIEARRGKDFRIERVDVRALLADVAAGHQVPAGRDAPGLPPDDRPRWVRADRKKLIQAVGNVLSNAYKYSPDGGPVSIELVEAPAVDASDVARHGIRIRDAGIGMTVAQLARVCERFYRADSSGKIPGTGLGMSIVKEIVELHGGHLEIASKPGQGTQVTLWLPAAPAES